MNIVAIFHSYKFTHFSDDISLKTKDPNSLTTGQKIKTLFFGVTNPRPKNKTAPQKDFEVVELSSNKKIECWSIKIEKPKGTVILYHGFGGEKSSLLQQSAIFNDLGYNTFLVDFMGSGGSEGNQTTIGFFESEQVKTSIEHIMQTGEEYIYLYGNSMGAVAIMKSINDHKINPKGVILECPFGTMSQTVAARFENMGVPTFPLSELLVFWGGVQNSFWAFSHNPTEYAKNIKCPTLLLYGAKDDKVSRSEINQIFTNLAGKKILKVYKNAGHENYLEKYKTEWNRDVKLFMK
jgi:alpha-beta hydrolase superfamily lysophospholipase